MTGGSRLGPIARAVLRTQSDDRLVELCREGRDGAFEEIVRRHRPALVAFAAAYAPAALAEDVVQESLVSSWNALRTSTKEIRLKPWLYTIVRNRALNARRDTRSHAPLDETIDGVRGPAEIALTNEELGMVVTAVSGLPEPQRRALVRSALEGHSHEQIAASLDSSPGAVRQLIFRARRAVREGVGALLPLPLVRMLADAGPGSEGAIAAVAAGGAGTAGGVSILTKVTVAAVVATITAASGVAIKQSADRGHADASTPGGAAGASNKGSGEDGLSPADPQGSGEAAPGGGGGSGPGSSDRDDDRRPDRDRVSDDDERDDERSGPSANSGPGSSGSETADDSSGHGGDLEDHPESSGSDGSGSSSSGSGSSSSGSSGSGSSSSGSSGSGSETEYESESSGSSGSGSGSAPEYESESESSGSSGSGSEPEDGGEPR